MDKSEPGVWKSARGKGRSTPKGRQPDDRSLAAIESLIGQGPYRRDLLIEYLHLLQDHYGHISADHICALAHKLSLSMAEVYEVASFYAHFDPLKDGEPAPPPVTIRVCDGLSCEIAGSGDLFAAAQAQSSSAQVRVVRAPCMGRCNLAPVAEVGHRHVAPATPDKIAAVLQAAELHPVIPPYEGFEEYRRGGGYGRLASLRDGADWTQAQSEVLSSGLRGLGGAGFPAGKKWEFVRAHPGPRFLAVNADEGEPGTFKDLHYLESRPHLILEGMLIAAWAVEASRCFIYLRDEYPGAREILHREIAALEAAGIIEPGYAELRRGAGAYICGEESAMIESLEGKRGLPRQRPPFVAERGLFGRPTLVHNVETLFWVARVLREGPQILSSVNKNGRTGMRSYSVSGRVAVPGVYLLPAGSTIRDVIAAAGGMAEGHTLKAYCPGGASSGLLPASLDAIPLDFDCLQEYGSFIGSAAVIVLSDHDSAREAALNMMRFFAAESCGQCTPCRVGCAKAVQLMETDVWDEELLGDLGEVMVDASICGLGQAAPNVFRSALRHFAQDLPR